jgi:uncharacterized membrane protein required for colicin V production
MSRTITLNWIDWVALAIVLVSVLRGSRYGVWGGLADLAALVASFFAASALYAGAARGLVVYFPMLPLAWAALGCFLVIWLVCYLPTSFLLRMGLGGLPFPASGLLGALLGAFRGLVLVAALLLVALAAPFRTVVSKDASHSQVAPYLLDASARVTTVLLPALPVRVPRIGPGGATF